MDHIIHYGTNIIDLTQALLDHRHGLTEQQIDQVETMRRRAVEFVTDFYQMQSVPVRRLRRYLNHDALSPVTVIIGYSEVLLMGAVGELTGPYLEAVRQICDLGYALHESLQHLHDEVWAFMQEMGIEK